MKEQLKNTYNFLLGYIRTKGKKSFSDMTIKDYNQLAKKYKLLTTASMEYMTKLNWRYFKNAVLKEIREEENENRPYNNF